MAVVCERCRHAHLACSPVPLGMVSRHSRCPFQPPDQPPIYMVLVLTNGSLQHFGRPCKGWIRSSSYSMVILSTGTARAPRRAKNYRWHGSSCSTTRTFRTPGFLLPMMGILNPIMTTGKMTWTQLRQSRCQGCLPGALQRFARRRASPSRRPIPGTVIRSSWAARPGYPSRHTVVPLAIHPQQLRRLPERELRGV